MEQGIITLEDSCKKFILDLIVLYDESYNLKKEYITHYLMMCNFNPPEAYFRTGELQQENFYYLILSKDKDSNKITGKVCRYYFAKKCFDARLNTLISRYSTDEEKDNFKNLNDVFKSYSMHVYHRFELITPSKEELESLRNIRSHSILSMALSPNIRHHYHYSKVTFNGEKLTEKVRFCKVFYLNFIF